jgi:hypothetical protein
MFFDGIVFWVIYVSLHDKSITNAKWHLLMIFAKWQMRNGYMRFLLSGAGMDDHQIDEFIFYCLINWYIQIKLVSLIPFTVTCTKQKPMSDLHILFKAIRELKKVPFIWTGYRICKYCWCHNDSSFSPHWYVYKMCCYG